VFDCYRSGLVEAAALDLIEERRAPELDLTA
jgi:hypothetical protein